MSFTDGKQRVATEGECKAPWHGYKDGRYFRCHLCGHKFVVGDKWRFIFGKGITNFVVCEKCDTKNDDELRDKYKEMFEESKIKFWWLWMDLEGWMEMSKRQEPRSRGREEE